MIAHDDGQPAARRLPLWKNYAEALVTRPSFGYGIEIPWAELEAAFSAGRDTGEFAGNVVGLVDWLKERGYFLVSRGTQSKGMRIAQREEMAELVLSEEKRKARHSMKAAKMLGAVDASSMKPEDQKALMRAQERAAFVSQFTRAALRIRELPPMPTITTKSVRQLALGGF